MRLNWGAELSAPYDQRCESIIATDDRKAIAPFAQRVPGCRPG